MSNAFCGNPFGIFLDAPGITAYTGTWAALVKVKPTARSYVMAAVYNGDPTIRANKYHGVNFRSTAQPSRSPRSVTRSTDCQATANCSAITSWAPGMMMPSSRISSLAPRLAAAGAFMGSSTRCSFHLAVPAATAGSASSARSLWHLIPRSSSCPCSSPRAFRRAECSTPARGMRLASASHPVSSATTCDGPQQKGLLPGPPGGQDYETVIELTYRFDLRNGALFIQPDLQYIIQPGGTSHIENALVLGTQIGINF